MPPHDAQEQRIHHWFTSLLSTLARQGQATAYIDTSDCLGLDELVACGCKGDLRRLAFVCPLSDACARALLETNPTLLLVTVDGVLQLSVLDG